MAGFSDENPCASRGNSTAVVSFANNYSLCSHCVELHPLRSPLLPVPFPSRTLFMLLPVNLQVEITNHRDIQDFPELFDIYQAHAGDCTLGKAIF